MKHNFKQFVAERDRRHRFQRRLISLLCVLSVLVSASVSMMLTMPGLTASEDPALSTGITSVVTDAATHNGWIDYFGISTDSENPGFNTQYAGSIWTDKSVFQSYTTSRGETISAGTGNMLGVLSAIGSAMAISGEARTPTDTMFILDLSSSMYKSGDSTYTSGNLTNMVKAVNESIDSLLSMNNYNRVGVVLYWGGSDVRQQYGADLEDGMVLLPLARYQIKTNKSYLSFSTSKGYTVSSSAVREDTNVSVSKSISNLPATAGTYAQLGVQLARQQFLDIPDEETYITLNAGETYEEKVFRQPIFVFMSDGRPTASHSHYDDLKYNSSDADTDRPITRGDDIAEWGLNSEIYRTSDASDFVFQLTSSYSKLVVGEHYGVKPLFYTLGLGVDKVSMNAMNPSGAITDSEELADQKTITNWWSELISSDKDSVTDSDSITIPVKWGTGSNAWTFGTIHNQNMTVHKVEVELRDGSTIQFPSSMEQMDYVDRYFSAANASSLSSTFTQIVSDITMKSIYTPTQVSPGRENTSGEVSFVDTIGEYMEVKAIKGILMGGVLYTGENFAKTLNEMGDLYNSNDLGLALWFNTIEQLGLESLFTTTDEGGETVLDREALNTFTQQLFVHANEAKQLFYDDTTKQFSNYIGWYADDGNSFVSFWDGQDEGQIPKGATQRIKTYFYQRAVSGDDESTMDTNMMYFTVWVRENIGTGQQSVVFSIPASLLPTLKYYVNLDADGNVESVHLGDVSEDKIFRKDENGNFVKREDGSYIVDIRPMRLVYEVGLREDITAQNLLDKVSAQYLAAQRSVDEDNDSDLEITDANVNKATGEVYFYANEWEREPGSDNRYTGYGKENTYSYFYPSHYNDRYYYTADTPIVDENGEIFSGDLADIAANIGNLHTVHTMYGNTYDSDQNKYYYGSETYQMHIGQSLLDSNSIVYGEVDGKDCWYVKAGTAHAISTTGILTYARPKDAGTAYGAVDASGNATTQTVEANATNTLRYRNIPFIDATTTTTTTTAGTYLLSATLGNNGRIAVAPAGQTLVKKIVDAGGNAFPATVAGEFQFLIHEGEPLGVDYNDGSAVWHALQGGDGTEDDKKVTLVTLKVAQGQSLSERQMLYNLAQYTWSEADKAWVAKEPTQFPAWDCVYLGTYTIAELTPDARYDAPAPITFQYGVYPEGETDHTIYAGNTFAPWQVNLTKTNDATEGTATLPGAIFGLYSSVQGDQLTQLPDGYTDFDLTYQDDQGSTWYLVQIKTTDENGLLQFENLLREDYLVRELQAPPGHFLPEEKDRNKLVSRDLIITPDVEETPVREDRLYEMTVSNTPGAEMPSTGGSGTLPYTIIGLTLMVSAVVLMLVYEISKRKEERA